MKNEFYFPSADGVNRIHAVEWVPENEVKAVLQISHGMVEYIERYAPFAEYLNGFGIYVTGNDHLGHGKTAADSEHFGYFGHPDGLSFVLSDIHTLRTLTEEKYPNVPYFLMGHSMGSFLVRNYISRHGEGLCGTVIMGTGSQPNIALDFGMALCKLLACFKGWTARVKAVNDLVFAQNKRFEKADGQGNWLSRNQENVDNYAKDPFCSFIFTLDGFYHLFSCIKYIQKKSSIEKTADCPLLLVSGADDPVGNCGKGVKKAYDRYIAAGKKAEMKLYADDRHEILNELDRDTVYADIKNWLAKTGGLSL